MVDPDLDPEVHKLYVASHNEYAPGEARNRGYDWQRTGVDPKTHAFGYFPDRIHDGVRKALNPATDPKVSGQGAVASNVVVGALVPCTAPPVAPTTA